MACGADYRLLGPKSTQLQAKVPVVAVCAVRTGAGKSQTSRRVVEILRARGVERIAVIRHPMPYGDLEAQRLQRFASLEDLRLHDCTLEEREEYEPHVRAGTVVFAGVDYAAILEAAQEEAELLVFDGGNNDFSFLVPDLLMTVVDPLRPGHETGYFPGEVNLRAAQLIVINKVDMATPDVVHSLRHHLRQVNPTATLVDAESRLTVDGQQIRGKKVMVVDDGPSLTHGDLPFGAGYVATMAHSPAELIDPRPYAVGSLAEVYLRFPHLGPVLPAMGYSAQQCAELRQTIEKSPAEVVVVGTPIDLGSAIGLTIPTLRVGYNLAERGPELELALGAMLEGRR